jgi:hypothetical protein
MTKSLFAIVLGLAACGGGGDSSTTDANPMGMIDAPNSNIDAAPVQTMITISGIASTISSSGKMANAGVAIVAKKVSDDSTIAMATSGADGTFSISAPTNGAAVDAYLVATKSGLIDTYLYPPGPLSMDFANVPIYQMTTSTQSLANQIGGADAQTAAQAWIGVVIQDATMTGVAGATFTATPAGGMIHYNSSSGLPQAQATSTAADGIGYYMNAPAGNVTVGATKTGSTFHSHTVNARAAKITLTLITP